MAGGASIIFSKLNNCQEAAYKSKKLASHPEFSIVILTANAVVGTSVQAVSSRPLKGWWNKNSLKDAGVLSHMANHDESSKRVKADQLRDSCSYLRTI